MAITKLTVDDIIERVLKKVDNDDFTEEDALAALNQCNVHIATEIYIKELFTVSEVTIAANTNSVALPDDFLREFKFAYNKTISEQIKVYDSRRLLDRKLRGSRTSGNVRYACNDYPNIFVKYTPASDNILDIYYCAIPDDLEEGGEFPGYIPNNYIYNLYFNYACARLWDFVEEGMEGEKVNTLYHDDQADEHLKKLILFIGPDPDEPFMPDGVNHHFDFSDV